VTREVGSLSGIPKVLFVTRREPGAGPGAAVKADVVFPGGPAAVLRVTAILARRSGGWKIVQCHASVGAANEEMAGKELTI
jgi:hypothetical protein